MKTGGVYWNLLLLFSILFSLHLVAGEVQEIGPFRTGQVITLTQTCSNCSFVNITRVTFPNSTQTFPNIAMSQPLPGNFNATFSSTQSNGEYVVTTCGDPDGFYECDDYTFVVNPLGKVLTGSQAGMYSLILIIAVIFFLLTSGMGIYLPASNKKDEMTGYILAVDNVKYLKMFFLGLSYLIFMVIVYFGYIVSYAYLDLDFLGNLLNILFLTLAYATLPLFLLSMYLVIANKVRDSEIGYQLSRGFKIK